MLGERVPALRVERGRSTYGLQIDLRELSSGAYFLHVVTTAGEHVEKVILAN